MAKRQCTFEESALSELNDYSIKLHGSFLHFMGKEYCKIGDLSKAELIRFLEYDNKLSRLYSDDFVEVSVTNCSSQKNVVVTVPMGEGMSSVMAVKRKVSDLLGIDVRCQMMEDLENNTGEELKDSDVLGYKEVSHDMKKFKLLLVESESCGALEWNNDNVFELNLDPTSPVLYEMESGGYTQLTVLANPAHVVVDAPPPIGLPSIIGLPRHSLKKAVFIRPFHPAKNYEDDGFDGDYSVSFLLSLDEINVQTPTPTLHEGCFFGMKSTEGRRNGVWTIDAYSARIMDDREGVVQYARRGFQPGDVITMRMNCFNRRLLFYRDGDEIGHCRLESAHFGTMSFVVHIPVVGFKITLVQDPVLDAY
jgi:hypothetical protein